jgi:hypothetical protein
VTFKLSNHRGRSLFVIFFTLTIIVAAMFGGANQATGAEADIAPAPASIGSDIPLTYFEPAPSQVQRELIEPYQLLKSGQIDIEAGTITLPLYQGRLRDGQAV